MGKTADRKEARRAARDNIAAARRNSRETILGLLAVALIGSGTTVYVDEHGATNTGRYDCGQELADYSTVAKQFPGVPVVVPSEIEAQCHLQSTISSIEIASRRKSVVPSSPGSSGG